MSGLPGPKKIKKAKFGHNNFQKSQILKCEKGQIKVKFSKKLFKINSGISFAKIGQKETIFIKILKYKKWPNGRINLPIGNPDFRSLGPKQCGTALLHL